MQGNYKLQNTFHKVESIFICLCYICIHCIHTHVHVHVVKEVASFWGGGGGGALSILEHKLELLTIRELLR